MPGFESWIDRQIREAQERGEFDNLRGAGEPLKGLGGRDDENWWIKGLIERENLRPPLPGSLLLRKETSGDRRDRRRLRDRGRRSARS